MNFWDFCGVNFHLLDLKKKKKHIVIINSKPNLITLKGISSLDNDFIVF